MIVWDISDGKPKEKVICDCCGEECTDQEYETIEGKDYCELCLRENVNNL